jgi:glycosyltransferase involved in cell wall biosynthesis
MSAAQSVHATVALAAPLTLWIEVISHLDPKYGGLSAAVPALSAGVRGHGEFDVRLAAFCADGEEFRPNGFTAEQMTYWPVGRKSWIKDQALRSRFEDALSSASGIHIHGLWEQSTAMAAKSARTLDIPYLISAHGMLEPWALANKRIKKVIYSALVERKNVQGAACLHALTRAEGEQYIRFGATSPIVVIPNGVAVPEGKDATLFFREFPETEGRRIVLFMARLHEKKGVDMLVKAWASITHEAPEALLVIAGPDADGMRARLEGVAAGLGITRSVIFAGMLRGAMKWSALAAAECFVLPSFSEGLSIAVLEAMGMGLPVIVTRHCNMPEVEEFKAGWQIEANVEELKAALLEVLSNPPSTNALIGRRGACLVSTRFSWEKVSAQMRDVYRWIQGGSKPQSVEVVVP